MFSDDFLATGDPPMRRSALVLLGLALQFATIPLLSAADFPLKDGDIWVMAGDSITAQHLHSNYFEAFCYARYPKIKFAFRNSGVGGHTIPSTLARFDYDIAAWKPTIVSVELGMNDQGGTPTDKFVANMGKMVGKIRDIKARPIILSASPMNNGDTLAKLGGNKRLDEFATALKAFAAKENIPYADQFHDLVDVWGKNKPNEHLLSLINTIQGASHDPKLEGVEHLKAFLAANEKHIGKLVSMQGDAVHPGPPGQLMMAAALLKELGAEGFVSSVTVNAANKQVEAKGCVVEDLRTSDAGVSFDRLDECSPFPIPDDAKQVLALYPTILNLSRYTLKVTGLKDGSYNLKVGDGVIATLSAKNLETGVNLTELAAISKTANPISMQSKAILGAVGAHAGQVGAFRNMSKAAIAPSANEQQKAALAAQLRKVEESDEKIREAAVPKKLRIEVSAAQ
jgi:lysophospholipase L1-like esterase